MSTQLMNDGEARMKKAIEALKSEMNKVRTGRAHPSLLDNVKVSYYGTDTPLSQVATVSAEDARTLAISPWEKHLVPDIEKAILSADLGLNPASQGDVIRVPLPQLTEERRKDLVRIVRAEAENARVSVRNARRDILSQLKEQVKAKDITEDDERRGQTEAQKLTDKYIEEIEKHVSQKEQELTTI